MANGIVFGGINVLSVGPFARLFRGQLGTRKILKITGESVHIRTVEKARIIK